MKDPTDLRLTREELERMATLLTRSSAKEKDWKVSGIMVNTDGGSPVADVMSSIRADFYLVAEAPHFFRRVLEAYGVSVVETAKVVDEPDPRSAKEKVRRRQKRDVTARNARYEKDVKKQRKRGNDGAFIPSQA